MNNNKKVIAKYENTCENRPMMYTDEMWVNTHNTKDSICVDSDCG